MVPAILEFQLKVNKFPVMEKLYCPELAIKLTSSEQKPLFAKEKFPAKRNKFSVMEKFYCHELAIKLTSSKQNQLFAK